MLTRRLFTAAALALALPLTFSISAAAQDAAPAAPAEPLPDLVIGDENAPVEIIEYASMTCPHCKAFQTNTFDQLKEEYIDTGKVKFIVREFPLDPLAAAVAMLARCSGERQFEVIDLFFERQSEWAVREGALEKIRNLALQTGFTNESFEACLTDQKLLDGINAVKDRGISEFGVRATPTFFINGERLEGAREIEAFREIIDSKLEG